jgi:hypothetical protein
MVVPEVGFALGEKLRLVAVAVGVAGRAKPDRRGRRAAYGHPQIPPSRRGRRPRATLMVVAEEGVEPSWSCPRGILSLAILLQMEILHSGGYKSVTSRNRPALGLGSLATQERS